MNPFLNLNFQKRRLLTNIKSFSQADQEKIIRAYHLAKKYHTGQKRDEGGPFVLHCLRVASFLIEELGIKRGEVIAAALLHDTVEDTSLELSEIEEKLGKRTSQMVKNLTRKKAADESELNKYQRKYQQFLETMKKDYHTRAIKICDFLDNMKSWPKMAKSHPIRKKFPRWFREAEEMYLPLAETVDQKMVKAVKEALAEAKKSSNG